MGAGAQPVVELGPRFHQPVPRPRSGALAAAQSQSLSLLSEIPLAEIERRAAELVLHSRINYAYRRQQEYLRGGPHLGRHACRRSAAASGGVFLGRVRPARIDARFIPAAWACWPAITSRARPIWIFRWSASACSTARDISGSGSIGNGWQQEEYLQTDVNQLPMEPAIGPNGEPVTVQIETRSGTIRAKVWRMKVGRCDLLLLDSNVEGNAPEDRELTSRLYGGDGRIRIRQELLLGVGGFRALRAMGITPGVLHLNEGHSGFAVLEAIRSRMEDEGHRLRRGRARGCPAKWCSRRTPRCPPATTASTPT